MGFLLVAFDLPNLFTTLKLPGGKALARKLKGLVLQLLHRLVLRGFRVCPCGPALVSSRLPAPAALHVFVYYGAEPNGAIGRQVERERDFDE